MISDIMKTHGTCEAAIKTMIDISKEEGGTDNITIVIASKRRQINDKYYYK